MGSWKSCYPSILGMPLLHCLSVHLPQPSSAVWDQVCLRQQRHDLRKDLLDIGYSQGAAPTLIMGLLGPWGEEKRGGELRS
jgi:hypothetical protein